MQQQVTNIQNLSDFKPHVLNHYAVLTKPKNNSELGSSLLEKAALSEDSRVQSI